MKEVRNAARCGLTAAALLLAAGTLAPVSAQLSTSDPDAAVACQAFERYDGGSWTATAPTTLAYDNGMVLNVAPGESFAPNQTVGGVEVTATLDRHCGNI